MKIDLKMMNHASHYTPWSIQVAFDGDGTTYLALSVYEDREDGTGSIYVVFPVIGSNLPQALRELASVLEKRYDLQK